MASAAANFATGKGQMAPEGDSVWQRL